MTPGPTLSSELCTSGRSRARTGLTALVRAPGRSRHISGKPLRLDPKMISFPSGVQTASARGAALHRQAGGSAPVWHDAPVLLFAEFRLGFLGDGPEVYDAPVYIHFLVGLPLAHVELVGDNAGTHFQVLEKLGAQLEVDVRQEVERHDGGIVEVGIEKVLLDEPHAVDRIKEAQENARQAGVTGRG